MKAEASNKKTTAGYIRADWWWIAHAASMLFPLILVRFERIGAEVPAVVATATGLAIIAAAFFLSRATEALETVVPQSVALALLALIEVASGWASSCGWSPAKSAAPFLAGRAFHGFGLDFAGLASQLEIAFHRGLGNCKDLDNLRSWSSLINRMQDTLS
jgi:hypothetical protein